MSATRKTEAGLLMAYIMAMYRGKNSPIGAKMDISRSVRSTVELGKLIRVCPGGHHAWFESNVGPVRKPWVK